MKAREIVKRVDSIYLARNNKDHIWRFRGKNGAYAYFSETKILLWKNTSFNEKRLLSLKGDGWQQISPKDIFEISAAYCNGDHWEGFPEEEEAFEDEEEEENSNEL
jgi:hypothetical protein